MANVLIYKESRYSVNRKAIREAVEEILSEQGIKRKTEVNVSIVGDRKMRDLNKKYAQKDETTDVLSFSLEAGDFINPPDNVLHLGDVVISYPQVVKNAAENNVLVDEEIKTLVKHGMLHLLGIHHEE
ncbi:rRNA maturation RNase YbeY [Candidatus Microgenomates bacterium]|nr:rRNA maturation RNase YbeY [Candidatus Microgenomates bacterium]